MDNRTGTLSPELLALLACPEDKGPLYYFADLEVLYNPRLQRVYRVRDGIPVMLIDEAQGLEPSEGERLFARIEAEAIPPTFSDAVGEAATRQESASDEREPSPSAAIDADAAVANRGFTAERRDAVAEPTTGQET